VGPPFEVAIYPKDSLALSRRLKLDEESPLLEETSKSWNQGIRNAFENLPRFDWELPPAGNGQVPGQVAPVLPPS